ncbi:magnesium transporter [Anoxybacillus ayderensis]|uniref:magnesium transporter n=1 Tax=Anoxybacillus ayderensis TaxID=265546 RepID=UPI000A26768B|nr:magnesium transporter [Anoxybacillus ayderensis]MED0657555.1 magnesium transporter [Anoxybacillus ayderensis]OSX54721.1 magnesium transporter [Anoxybacillus ayderensis]
MIRLDQYQFKEEYTYYLLHSIKNEDKEAFRKDFFALHSYDQADFYLSLDKGKRKILTKWLDPKEFSNMFQHLHSHEQLMILNTVDDEYMKQVIKHMYSDDIVDLITYLSSDKQAKVLEWLDQKQATNVKQLLTYERGTAGALMITEFVCALPTDTISSVMNRIRFLGDTVEVIYYIYVIDEHGKMVGVLSIRDLLAALPNQCIQDVMKTKFIYVSPTSDQSIVVHLLKKYDLLALPVLQDGKLVGVITVDDIMDIMEEERKEQLEDISATRGATDWDTHWFQSFKKRIVWLVILLFLAFATSHLIHSFHEVVQQLTMLVPFLPIVLGMGGNAGIQSLAIAIRRLAIKEETNSQKVKYLLVKETMTGVLLGIVCGMVASAICYVVTGYNITIAFVVGVSLCATIVISNLFGAIVPIIINRFRLDPAIASGPFVTTMNDLIGTFIYFTTALACYHVL